ncbi:hypothetical protein CEXT_609931, partial [Caerostris extrusa]
LKQTTKKKEHNLSRTSFKRAHDTNLYLCSYSADPFFCPRLVSAAKKPMGRKTVRTSTPSNNGPATDQCPILDDKPSLCAV